MQQENEKADLIKFDKLKADVTIFVEPIMAITVTDQDSADHALAVAREVKAWSKKVEERRVELVDPHNKTVKSINAYAKSIAEPLMKAESMLKGHLSKWEIQLEQKRQAAMRAANEERARLEKEAMAKLKAQQEADEMENLFKSEVDTKRDEIVAQVETERVVNEIQEQHRANVHEIQSQKVSGARKVWSFEVTEPNRVPQEFWVIDEKKIRAAIASGVREISGVRVFQETSIAIR